MQISNCEVSHPYFGSVEGLLTSMITGISLQTKPAVGCWLYEIKKQMTSFFLFFLHVWPSLQLLLYTSIKKTKQPRYRRKSERTTSESVFFKRLYYITVR